MVRRLAWFLALAGAVPFLLATSALFAGMSPAALGAFHGISWWATRFSR